MSWSAGEIVTAPTAAPISLDDVKAHLRIDGSDADVALEAFRQAAIDDVARYTGLALAPQIVRYCSPGWEDLRHLPVAPITSVEISYLDVDYAEHVLDASSYRLIGADTLSSSVAIKSAVTRPIIAQVADAVRVTISCGYTTVPPAIKLAMLMLTADWELNRENSVDATMAVLPTGVERLLANYRLFN